MRLENPNCCVRSGCVEHPPWPEGICTKCQPRPVTLDIQPFRMIDYVQFENAGIMEGFLDYWRKTGKQRVGILLGYYLPFDNPGAPPLAIKAVVAVIYEPPQTSTNRSVTINCPLEELLSPTAKAVNRGLGLRPVGWIFTDLTADTSNNGTVKHYRGSMDTFFLSSQECITAARLQNLYPTVCRHSPDGYFGSRFVTVVVTGDSERQIHFEGYQVTNVGMALERANVLLPTYDAPELGYIRETTKEQFVPEVFYSAKDKYGNTVTNVARPLPIEYLLINMPAAFPIKPCYTLACLPTSVLRRKSRFPIENRADLGQLQNYSVFARYFHRLGADRLHSCLANWHVLVWLAEETTLPP